VNKAKKVSNGNYLWISYFWSYLSEKGRAGFVMSSQASSAGHGEKEVRQKIVETGDVDVMISIRSKHSPHRPCSFGSLTVEACCAQRPGARSNPNVYRVTRKIYDPARADAEPRRHRLALS
jgi:type I restriction enzyme M protein